MTQPITHPEDQAPKSTLAPTAPSQQAESEAQSKKVTLGMLNTTESSPMDQASKLHQIILPHLPVASKGLPLEKHV